MVFPDSLKPVLALLTLKSDQDNKERRQHVSDLSKCSSQLSDIIFRHPQDCLVGRMINSLHHDIASLLPIQKAIVYEQAILDELERMGVDIQSVINEEKITVPHGLDVQIDMMNQERVRLYEQNIAIGDLEILLSTDRVDPLPGSVSINTNIPIFMRLDAIRRTIYKNSRRLPVRHHYGLLCASLDESIVKQAKQNCFSGRGYLGRRQPLPFPGPISGSQ